MRQVVYLDVETVPPQDADTIDRATELLDPPSNYKSADAIEKWRAGQAERLGLKSWAAEPCTLCLDTLAANNPLCLQRGYDEDPADFFDRMATGVAEWSHENKISMTDMHLAGWNVSFDLSMLRAWSVRYERRIDLVLPAERYAKSYTDVMALWNPWENTALRKAHFAITGEVYADSGADVAEQFRLGETGDIMQHCYSDVVRTMVVHHALERTLW